MSVHTERDFETAIEAGLIGAGGYQKRAAKDYEAVKKPPKPRERPAPVL